MKSAKVNQHLHKITFSHQHTYTHTYIYVTFTGAILHGMRSYILVQGRTSVQ